MNDDIDARLDRIESKLDALLALLKAPAGVAARSGATTGARTAPASNASAETASDADLDGMRGNPEVRFIPKRWTGADFKGKNYSDCEPEFLDMLADALDWFATRDDEQGTVDKNGNPRSRWNRLDASRARGWAMRKRGGEAAPAKSRAPAPARRAAERPPTGDLDAFGPPPGDDADIPF